MKGAFDVSEAWPLLTNVIRDAAFGWIACGTFIIDSPGSSLNLRCARMSYDSRRDEENLNAAPTIHYRGCE